MMAGEDLTPDIVTYIFYNKKLLPVEVLEGYRTANKYKMWVLIPIAMIFGGLLLVLKRYQATQAQVPLRS